MRETGVGQPNYLSQLIPRSLRAWGPWRGLIAALLAFGVAWLFGELSVILYSFTMSVTTTQVITAAFLVWFGTLLTFFTPKKMWEESVRRITDLEDQLRPKLELVFGGNQRPYQQVLEFMPEVDVTIAANPIWMENRYRVGVRNSSSVTIEAELILEECSPRFPNVFPHHALQVMDERNPTKRVMVPPSGKERVPTKFFDVVYERWRQNSEGNDFIFLAYYQNVPNHLPNGQYVLTLRLDGGPSPVRMKLLVEKSRLGNLQVSLAE